MNVALPTGPKRRGFVLPTTVAILALVSVGLAMMAHRSDDLRRLVQAVEAERQASRQVADARAEAEYLSSVLHRRSDSLGSIKLDGQAYLSASGAVVRYTDAAALLSLRRVSRLELSRLLIALGLNSPQQVDRLTDVLLDYTDRDELQQLNGAEGANYSGVGMPPPRNERLHTPTEVTRLLDWRDLPEGFLDQFLANVHVGSQRTVNRHTVKPAALAAITGLDASVANDLVAARPAGQMLNTAALPTVEVASYLAESRFITVPSTQLLVTICSPLASWCEHVSLTSSGESAHGPWHISYAYRLPRRAALPVLSQLEKLPDQLPDKPPPPLYSPFNPAVPVP